MLAPNEDRRSTNSGVPADQVPRPSHLRMSSPPPQQRYTNYLIGPEDLDTRLAKALVDADVSRVDQSSALLFLAPLKEKHLPTYYHCVRVGLLAAAIARHESLDPRALLLAGLLHDCGKALCSFELLDKTAGWNDDDSAVMQLHVVDGHRLLRGRFDFTADVIARHHTFQADPYPTGLPSFLHTYSAVTLEKINLYARILALADSFDALHRINGRNGSSRALDGVEIREAMLEANPDQRARILALYEAGIFTTHVAS